MRPSPRDNGHPTQWSCPEIGRERGRTILPSSLPCGHNVCPDPPRDLRLHIRPPALAGFQPPPGSPDSSPNPIISAGPARPRGASWSLHTPELPFLGACPVAQEGVYGAKMPDSQQSINPRQKRGWLADRTLPPAPSELALDRVGPRNAETRHWKRISRQGAFGIVGGLQTFSVRGRLTFHPFPTSQLPPAPRHHSLAWRVCHLVPLGTVCLRFRYRPMKDIQLIMSML